MNMSMHAAVHRRRQLGAFYGETGGPLFVSTFSGGDTASALGTSDSGHLWTEDIGWKVTSGQADPELGANDMPRVNLGNANVDLRCNIYGGALVGEVGLAFCIVDDSNFWCWIALSATQMLLRKVVAGANTNIGAPAATVNDGSEIRAYHSGSMIECYVDGAMLISTSDAEFSTATTHGLRRYGSTASSRVDNVVGYAL
jgi:hypothetical protein